MPQTRYDAGLAKLTEIDGQAGQNVIDNLADIAPDLGTYIIEFAFGDIYRRGTLDLQQRELITISALSAMGGCQPQLLVHVNGALNVGCRPKEIVETMIHIAVYAGFPAALNAIAVAKQVFAERNIRI
jgi:4-carboxymuconolactone decarboxylase